MPVQEDIYFELQDSKASNGNNDSESVGKKRGRPPKNKSQSDNSARKAGRPPKREEEKYKSTHICFHPKIVEWAKAEAKRRGVGYQSVINETLLEHIASYITS